MWHVGGLSKTISAALRFGYVVCPAGMGEAEAWFDGMNAEGEKSPVGVWYLYLELLP